MVYAKFVLENETHKLFWDFELQTDALIWSDDQTYS